MKQTKARKDRLEKMVAERTAYWEQKRPNWKTTSPAVIEKPLKLIRRMCLEQTTQEDDTTMTTVNPVFYMALDFARAGLGRDVNLIARTLLSK